MATQKLQALYWNQDLAPKRVIPKLMLFFRDVSASLHLSGLQQPVYPPAKQNIVRNAAKILTQQGYYVNSGGHYYNIFTHLSFSCLWKAEGR